MVLRVIPSKTVLNPGVIKVSFFTMKKFSPDPSFTVFSVSRISASSYPDESAS